MRSATQPYCNTVEYSCVALRMRLFSQNFGTIKRILPGSSSPSHREGPGTEVVYQQILFFHNRRARFTNTFSQRETMNTKTVVRIPLTCVCIRNYPNILPYLLIQDIDICIYEGLYFKEPISLQNAKEKNLIISYPSVSHSPNQFFNNKSLLP